VKNFDVADWLLFSGSILFVFGVGMMSVPAAFVAAGLICAGWSYLIGKGGASGDPE
jgi:hypothetical protein